MVVVGCYIFFSYSNATDSPFLLQCVYTQAGENRLNVQQSMESYTQPCAHCYVLQEDRNLTGILFTAVSELTTGPGPQAEPGLRRTVQ